MHTISMNITREYQVKSQSHPLGNQSSLSSLMGLLHTLIPHNTLTNLANRTLPYIPLQTFPTPFHIFVYMACLWWGTFAGIGHNPLHWRPADGHPDAVNPRMCALVCMGTPTQRAAGRRLSALKSHGILHAFSNLRAEDASLYLPEFLQGAKCPQHSEYRKAEAMLNLKFFVFILKEGWQLALMKFLLL